MTESPSASVNQLAAALRYAALGWQVIPLHTPTASGCSCARSDCDRSRGKHPRFSDWVKRATTDETAIRGWWRTWPAANVGLVTGARSGFFVLDVDPDHGGEVTLSMLCAEHGALPATVEAHTGSGGRHLLFRYPGHHVPNSTSRLGKGLDVRGDGGQIVAAPSLHRSGSAYEWQPDCEPGRAPIAEAPAWLLELLKPAAPPPRAPAAPRTQTGDQARRRASAYLARIPGGIGTGGHGGHNQTWSAALAIVRGFRLSEGEAFELLWTEYNPRCDPPWSEKEVQHKVTQALNNASVPFGYLLDAERPQRQLPPAVPSREPGSDDDDESGSQGASAGSDAPRELSSKWGIQSADEFLAREFPPVRFLYLDLVPADSVTVLMAAPNAGKTFMALEIGCQVAAAAAKQGLRVAIVEEEGAGAALQTRLRRAIRATEADPTRIGIAWNTQRSLLNAKHLAELVEEVQGADLVILDSLAALTEDTDENDSEAMGRVAQALHYLKSAANCAVLALHHMTKEAWKENETPTLRHMRGHSKLPGRVDAVIALTPSESDKDAVRFDLHVIKMRDGGEKGAPRKVEVSMVGDAAHVIIETVEQGGVRGSTKMRDQVLACITKAGEQGASKRWVCQVVTGTAERIRGVVDELHAEGRIEKNEEGRYVMSVESTATEQVPAPQGQKPSVAEQRVSAILPLVLAAIPLPPDPPVFRADLQDKLGKRRGDVLAATATLIDQGAVRELSRNRLIRVPSAPAERAE